MPGYLFNTLTGERCSQTVFPNAPVNGNPIPAVTPNIVQIFTKDLSLLVTDPQVKLLQRYLNIHGFPVANSGVGSLGKETTLFGYATKAALIRFQKAKGLAPAVGYFGPVTRKFVNGN